MSLQLWMPLMGDLRNQGLGDYSISTLGTLSWVTGKLGSQAMRAGDGTQVVNGIRIEDTFTNLLNGNYSVSVWVKPYGQHVHYNGSIFSSGDWNKANKRWTFGVSQDNSKVDVLCLNHNTYITCSVPENEWTHLVCARGDDDIVKLYKNGQYIGERNCSSDAAFDSDATFSCIGRESYANGYFSFNGAIQDFRLYNHCLSPMEIKQLSQGLVLHYPLNRGGFGQENLFSQKYWTYSTSGWAGNVISSVAGSTIKPIINSDGSCILTGAGSSGNSQCYLANSNHKVNLTANKTYTISVLVTSTNISKFRFWWYDYDSSGNRLATLATNTFTINNGETKLLSYTRTLSENTASCYWELNMYGADTSATLLLHAHSLKLEEGSTVTPWCPNSSDELATTMGLNSIVEYDCSGYCNNGTRTGTFIWTSDTPKYSVSTAFSGSQYITEDNEIETIDSTIAVWVKTSLSANAFILDCRNSSGTGKQPIYQYTNGSIQSGGASQYVTTNTGLLVANTWIHLTIVQSGSSLLVYKNGSLFQTLSCPNSSIIKPTIGARYSLSSLLPSGSISDLRIYATALSADDVKSLYQNCATIDPDGTIRGQIRS